MLKDRKAQIIAMLMAVGLLGLARGPAAARQHLSQAASNQSNTANSNTASYQ